MLLTIWNLFGHWIMGGNQAVLWPPIIATRYVIFATTQKLISKDIPQYTGSMWIHTFIMA